jgi:hypothetical protein
MSDDEKTTSELKYYERLNISVLTIANIKRIIKNDIQNTLRAWDKEIDVDKQCFHIIGPAGVGKTQICYQIASELSHETGKAFEIIMVKAPVLSKDDFIIPYPVLNSENKMTGSFQMLYSDFVPKPTSPYGIFVIDEFSRGDHALQQLLWQVQNEYCVHRYLFPKGWFVISVDNPDDAEYQMDTMEDAAGLRRQLHLYTEASAKDFLDYAIANNFHHYIIEFIQTHPEYLYDFGAQKIGSVFANPASYEKLSDHLKKFDEAGGSEKFFDDIEIIASGLLNVNMARLFLEFARDKKDINPKDVFYNLDKVEKDIKALLKEGDMNKLGQLMTGFTTFLTTSMPRYEEKELNNIKEFMLMMPVDTAALFISQIDGFARTSKEFKYMTDIHITLMKKSKRWKEQFYETIVKVGRSGD